jgi:hypothetical protein
MDHRITKLGYYHAIVSYRAVIYEEALNNLLEKALGKRIPCCQIWLSENMPVKDRSAPPEDVSNLAEYATRIHASAYRDDGNEFSSILLRPAARGATLTIRVSIRFYFTGREGGSEEFFTRGVFIQRRPMDQGWLDGRKYLMFRINVEPPMVPLISKYKIAKRNLGRYVRLLWKANQ